MKNSTNAKLRSTTTANLCFLYLKTNEHGKAENLVKTLPHIWESREMLWPEIFSEGEYIEELKKVAITTLTVICEKIKSTEKHKCSNPDKTIALGMNLNSIGDLREKIELLSKFLDVDF